MGKRKGGHKKQSQSYSKRPKLPKYWVEDFPELELETSDISLYITRVNLSDAHHPMQLSNNLNEEQETKMTVPSSGQQENVETIQVNASLAVPSMNHHHNNSNPNEQQQQQQQCDTIQTQDSQKESQETKENKHFDRKLLISVKRAPYPPLTFHRDPQFRHRKNGDNGDGIINPYSKKDVPDKYWAQRKRLFTRFSDGIQLDVESWYSVTPEVIANHIAQRMVVTLCHKKDGITILDAFCGVGGNTIAFARRPEVNMVICVDTNFSRLEMAAHNCEIYEIPKHKIIFIHADVCEVLQFFISNHSSNTTNISNEIKKSLILSGYTCYPNTSSLSQTTTVVIDSIFMSPPWGGVEYAKIGPRQYSLSNIHLSDNVDGEELLRRTVQTFLATGQQKHIVMFLPRNLNGLSFAQSAFRCGLQGSIELEMNLIDSKFKAITAYIMDSKK